MKRLTIAMMVLALAAWPCVVSAQFGAAIANQAPLATPALTLQLADAPQPVSAATVSRLGNPGLRTLYYWIVTRSAIGQSAAAGPFELGRAPNAYGSGVGAKISWAPAVNATSYDVLRTASPAPPSGACNCAVATGLTTASYTDISESLSAYTVAPVDPNAYAVRISNRGSGPGASQLSCVDQRGNSITAGPVCSGSSSIVAGQGVTVSTEGGTTTVSTAASNSSWYASTATYTLADVTHPTWSAASNLSANSGTISVNHYGALDIGGGYIAWTGWGTGTLPAGAQLQFDIAYVNPNASWMAVYAVDGTQSTNPLFFATAGANAIPLSGYDLSTLVVYMVVEGQGAGGGDYVPPVQSALTNLRITANSGPSVGGNVIGPPASTPGHLAVFYDDSGRVLADGGGVSGNAASGHVWLGATLIQWATGTTVNAASSTQTINWDIPFPNGCLNPSANMKLDAAMIDQTIVTRTWAINAYNTTGITVSLTRRGDDGHYDTTPIVSCIGH